MTSRTCEEYRGQENGKEDRQENEVRRRKKNFQREVVEENAPEENGISNRLFSSTFIPPLTSRFRRYPGVPYGRQSHGGAGADLTGKTFQVLRTFQWDS
jgi:hypothetical protein